jgi:hypothetical protein
MKEITKEEFDARQNQFKSHLRSILTEGGSFVSGDVTGKSSAPPKDGRDSTYRVQLSTYGKTFSVKVSKSLWDSIGIGSFQVFCVNQTAFDRSVYNTALE